MEELVRTPVSGRLLIRLVLPSQPMILKRPRGSVDDLWRPFRATRCGTCVARPSRLFAVGRRRGRGGASAHSLTAQSVVRTRSHLCLAVKVARHLG